MFIKMADQLNTWLLDHELKVLWVNVTRVTRDM